MALCVWLPLIDGLHNQGLDQMQITCSGNEMYVNGLFDSSIRLKGQTLSSSTITKQDNVTSFDFGGWINTTEYVEISLDTNCGTYLIMLSVNRLLFMHNSANAPITTIVSDTILAGTWNHIFVEYDNHVFTIFVNGKAIKEINIDYDIKFTEYSLMVNSIGTVKLNDIRIYDSAVGRKYIDILSMGLYTRYTLSSYLSVMSPQMTIADSAGYKHNGILYNPAYIQTTKASRGKMAYIFNNRPKLNYIRINETGLVLPSTGNQFTISLWYNSTLYPQGDILYLLDGNLRITEQGIIINNTLECFDNYNIVQDTWTLLTITFDNGIIRIYRNNTLTREFDCSDTITEIENNATLNSYIGAGIQSNNMVGYKGALSDMRIYATALDTSHIKELYCSPIHITNTGKVLMAGEVVESWE